MNSEFKRNPYSLRKLTIQKTSTSLNRLISFYKMPQNPQSL